MILRLLGVKYGFKGVTQTMSKIMIELKKYRTVAITGIDVEGNAYVESYIKNEKGDWVNSSTNGVCNASYVADVIMGCMADPDVNFHLVK